MRRRLRESEVPKARARRPVLRQSAVEQAGVLLAIHAAAGGFALVALACSASLSDVTDIALIGRGGWGVAPLDTDTILWVALFVAVGSAAALAGLWARLLRERAK